MRGAARAADDADADAGVALDGAVGRLLAAEGVVSDAAGGRSRRGAVVGARLADGGASRPPRAGVAAARAFAWCVVPRACAMRALCASSVACRSSSGGSRRRRSTARPVARRLRWRRRRRLRARRPRRRRRGRARLHALLRRLRRRLRDPRVVRVERRLQVVHICGLLRRRPPARTSRRRRLGLRRRALRRRAPRRRRHAGVARQRLGEQVDGLGLGAVRRKWSGCSRSKNASSRSIGCRRAGRTTARAPRRVARA